jgi:hypothetical protein
MVKERIWLDVGFEEKDTAKASGARWDPGARRWYAPRPGITALERWLAREPLPYDLPGEDRALGSGLFVDLVPKTCWVHQRPVFYHQAGLGASAANGHRPCSSPLRGMWRGTRSAGPALSVNLS